MTKWPDHYPEQCPPSCAEAISGTIYRFTNRANPKQRDFISYYDMDPSNDWGRMACNARGLSVYSTYEDCVAAVDAVPALRKKRLCHASLTRDSGVIADTPSQNTQNHKTFWSYVDAIKLASLFISTDSNDGVEVNHA
ncbi:MULTISPECIES: hypothetical protein [Pseudomonas syringae group]|uniref:hypothetical protein n=1 Tax=Pseudomonas syringae group TaxID=136849 RepID=UPI0011C38980|nr:MULTISPECIES: hypothetical protein [Pseudomonas syringae group]